jgi:hypothetical protein
MRANVSYTAPPKISTVKGDTVGFNTDENIKVWQFDFRTEREDLFENNGNPVGYLLEDFNGVPYISGLDEWIEQNYSVFVTDGPARNIIFSKKQ